MVQKLFAKLKTESIRNYQIVTRRTILGLQNITSNSPLTLLNFSVVNGTVTNPKTNFRSNNVVEIHTELLRVAIIEDLSDEAELEEVYLKNYEGEIDYSDDVEPTIEEVD